MGSVKSVIEFSTKRLRKIPSMFYLNMLVVADLAVLYTGELFSPESGV